MVEPSHTNSFPDSLFFWDFYSRAAKNQCRGLLLFWNQSTLSNYPKWFCYTTVLMLWTLFHAGIYEGLQQNFTFWTMLWFTFVQWKWKEAEDCPTLIFSSAVAEPASVTRVNPVLRAESFHPAPFITYFSCICWFYLLPLCVGWIWMWNVLLSYLLVVCSIQLILSRLARE